MFDVLVVCFGKRARFDGVIEGENGVPLVHLRVVHDAHHRFQAPLRDVKDASHVILHVVTRDGVGRKRGGRRRNRGMHCLTVNSGNWTHGFRHLLLERKGKFAVWPLLLPSWMQPSQDVLLLRL